MPSRPKFSVVIPTRDRCRSLAATLQTCFEIDHPDFEIVVSDNHSSDATAEVVANFADARIRYTQPPAATSMGRNFEHALRQARGEFVIIIGDDDGILPFGLKALEALFARYRSVDAIDWVFIPFVWPDAPTATLKLNWLSNLRGFEFETAEEAWRRINHPRSIEYYELGGFNIYHGCVRRRVLDATEAAGVSLCGAPIPDVAASIRILRFARLRLRLDVAMTVNAASRSSNGLAGTSPTPTQAQSEIRSDFRRMTAADFPNASLADSAWTRENAFLAPLLDEHLERFGNLGGIDSEVWRRIYILRLSQLPSEQVEPRRVEANEIFAWMEARGAPAASPISAKELNAEHPRPWQLMNRFMQAFRFSDELLASAVEARRSSPRPLSRDSRIVGMGQREAEIDIEVRAAGEEFNIHDYVRVLMTFLSAG